MTWSSSLQSIVISAGVPRESWLAPTCKMDQQKFLEQLQIVLDPTKGNVKTATGLLQNEFYKQPDSLAFLLQLVISHDSAALKQLAAVEAKPLVKK